MPPDKKTGKASKICNDCPLLVLSLYDGALGPAFNPNKKPTIPTNES
jgi:hypothetical protein